MRIHVVEDFSGASEGMAEFLQTARSEDEASFVGVERVSGGFVEDGWICD